MFEAHLGDYDYGKSTPPPPLWAGGDQIPFYKVPMPSAISPSLPSFSTMGTPKTEHPRAALGWPPYALQERGFFPASSREGKSLQVLWRGLAWVACPPLSQSYSQGEVPCGRHYCSSVLPPSSGNSIRLPLETHSFLISHISVGAGNLQTPPLGPRNGHLS